jgi:hypothetical protein
MNMSFEEVSNLLMLLMAGAIVVWFVCGAIFCVGLLVKHFWSGK